MRDDADIDDADIDTAAPPVSALYEIVAAALDYLEAHQERQPSLEELAERMGYSQDHFQRVFSAHVGVSPKKYLGYLTLSHAKRLLDERASVLDAALGAGLSSPSRLHDLFVTWEAMTPGAYAAGGAGLTVRYGFFETPFGEAVATATERGLCGLGFVGDLGRAAALDDLLRRWPKAAAVEDPEAAAPWVDAAVAGKGAARLHLMGAPFQIKVWEALLTIPPGHVATYSDLAAAVGHPKAVRAVGTAVGRNPVSWLIPCHRALRKSGALGGYHWGLKVKRALLAYETAQQERRA